MSTRIHWISKGHSCSTGRHQSSCCFSNMPAYSPRAFYLLSQSVLGVKDDDRSFRAHTGTTPDVCSLIWNRISANEQRSSYMQPVHLLWALHFLKVYSTEDVIVSRLDTTRKTYRKWVWKVLRLICRMKREVVRIIQTQSLLAACLFSNTLVLAFSFLYMYRSNGQTESVLVGNRIDSACVRLMEQTFEFASLSHSTLGGTRTSLKVRVCAMKLLSLSMAVILFISMVHSCAAIGLI